MIFNACCTRSEKEKEKHAKIIKKKDAKNKKKQRLIYGPMS